MEGGVDIIVREFCKDYLFKEGRNYADIAIRV